MASVDLAFSRTCEPACDVLIVEDDSLQAEELAAFLRRAGLKVQIEHDASTALHRAAVAQPCVALLDYNLPGLNGTEIAARIRCVSPLTAVILISGRLAPPSPAALAQLGIYAFQGKPLALDKLHRMIVRVIRDTKRTGRAQVARPWSARLGF
jgi:DNA-binding NtrC family response regulator